MKQVWIALGLVLCASVWTPAGVGAQEQASETARPGTWTRDITLPHSVAVPWRAYDEAAAQWDDEAAFQASVEALDAAEAVEIDADIRVMLFSRHAQAAYQTGRFGEAAAKWRRAAEMSDAAGQGGIVRAGYLYRTAVSALDAGDPAASRAALTEAIAAVGPINLDNLGGWFEIRRLEVRLDHGDRTIPEGFVDAVPEYRPHPPYPTSAARNGGDGAVLVRFGSDARGRVDSIEILEAFPAGLFERGIEGTLSRWRYQPATVNGTPVRRDGLMAILEYRLDRSRTHPTDGGPRP